VIPPAGVKKGEAEGERRRGKKRDGEGVSSGCCGDGRPPPIEVIAERETGEIFFCLAV